MFYVFGLIGGFGLSLREEFFRWSLVELFHWGSELELESFESRESDLGRVGVAMLI